MDPMYHMLTALSPRIEERRQCVCKAYPYSPVHESGSLTRLGQSVPNPRAGLKSQAKPARNQRFRNPSNSYPIGLGTLFNPHAILQVHTCIPHPNAAPSPKISTHSIETTSSATANCASVLARISSTETPGASSVRVKVPFSRS